MSGLLSSIPSLVPTPSRSVTPHSSAVDDEADVDRYATLFSPATPRASPTSSVPELPAVNIPNSRPSTHSIPPPSPDSEFGSFVSVSDDPLSGIPAFTPTSSDIRGLDFFEEAKRADEKNRRGVLDELLQHEDDPLYFLDLSADSKPQPQKSQQSPEFMDLTADEPAAGPSNELPREQRRSATRHAASHAPNTHRSSSTDRIHFPIAVTSPSLARVSSSMSSARPEPSTHMSASTPSLTSIRASPPKSTPTPPPISPSWTYTLGPKWMSSLLSNARPPPSARGALSTMFNDPSLSAMAPGAQTMAHRASTIGATATAAISNMIPDAQISHGTPFASRDFVPTSGAPGFSGDDHTWDKGYSEDFERVRAEQRHVKLNGRRETTNAVLTPSLVDLIRPHLPALSRLRRTWSLMYSLDQHGISLKTMYARCESEQPKSGDMGHAGALVVMKDANDAIFGAYIAEGVRLSRGSYYGSGESFLWRFHQETFQVFKWTGKNEYVALCEPDFVSFGGGDGNYGLYLDESLMDGSSARCPTFGNEPLCAPAPRRGGAVTFECVGLEAWAIGP